MWNLTFHKKIQVTQSIVKCLIIYSEATARTYDVVNVALGRSALQAFPVCDGTGAVLGAALVV